MAGGKGIRLGAQTLDRPKALVKLDDHYDMLSVILHQLRRSGFRRITVCVSHLAEMVWAAFGDGSHLGVAIDYCVDTVAAGTAGPLRGVANYDEPALVMNGDVLTTMDFAQLYASHLRDGAALTIGVVTCHVPVEHGVLEVRDDRVVGIVEKPRLALTISGGVYVASPRILRFLPAGVPTDMPDLVSALVATGEVVHAYRTACAWFDIGTPPELERARRQFSTDRARFLGPPPAVQPAAVQPVVVVETADMDLRTSYRVGRLQIVPASPRASA